MPNDPLDMSTVLASTVHDVKNSLGLINAQLEELITEISGCAPEASQKLRRIHMESNRINSGLSHMLGVYRIDNNLMHPSIEEVLVYDVLDDAASRYASSMENQGIHIRVEMDDEDLTWFMDPDLIHHVIANILTNAIRYTKDEILLSAFVEDEQLCIAIDDNGNGYPEALLHCLAPDASLNVKTSSTGLGIYFAHRIAALHTDQHQQNCGRIELSNKHAGGARFAVWLP